MAKQRILDHFGLKWKAGDVPILIVLGNWGESASSQPFTNRFRPSVPTKGIVSLFANDPRFFIVLVDESFTTQTCSFCQRLTLKNSPTRMIHKSSFQCVGKRFAKRVRKKKKNKHKQNEQTNFKIKFETKPITKQTTTNNKNKLE